MPYVATQASYPVRLHHRPLRRRGLGQTAAQVVGQGGGAAGGVVTAAAAPAVATALGISASLAVPIVGAAFAGILLGVEAILNSGCGQTCVVTSQWANQAEPLLKQNIAQYFSIANRTAMDKQSALNVFDAVWAGLVQRCSQGGLGSAGQRCISDRQSGACKWHATEDSPYPGGPKQGECFNWWNAYRDPIAGDTQVGGGASGIFSSLSSGGGSSSSLPLLLVAGLVLVAVLM